MGEGGVLDSDGGENELGDGSAGLGNFYPLSDLKKATVFKAHCDIFIYFFIFWKSTVYILSIYTCVVQPKKKTIIDFLLGTLSIIRQNKKNKKIIKQNTKKLFVKVRTTFILWIS